MERTISRMSVSTKFNVTSPPWPETTAGGAVTAAVVVTPRASKAGNLFLSLGIAPLTRGSAACNLAGASIGVSATGSDSHPESDINAVSPIAGSGPRRPLSKFIPRVSGRWVGAQASQENWAHGPEADPLWPAAARAGPRPAAPCSRPGTAAVQQGVVVPLRDAGQLGPPPSPSRLPVQPKSPGLVEPDADLPWD